MTALDRYRLEVDGTTVMHRLTRGYSEDQLQAISDYLGAGQDE
jgi:cytochrome c553